MEMGFERKEYLLSSLDQSFGVLIMEIFYSRVDPDPET